MTARENVAVVVRLVRVIDGGPEARVTYYGPFMPHCGSAVDRMIERLHDECGEDVHEISREDVFLGEGESDLQLVYS